MARLLSANIVGALLSFLAIRIHAKSSQHPFMYSNTSFCTPTAVALDFFHRIAFSFFFFKNRFLTDTFSERQGFLNPKSSELLFFCHAIFFIVSSGRRVLR